MKHMQRVFPMLVLGLAMAVIVQHAPAQSGASDSNNVQVAAYYFPAWHKNALDPGNEGEWSGLKKAKPRFAGQHQPVVPLWGYQDESDPAAMAQKIDAAADNDVSVFIFDWYWHDRGKWKGPVLEKTLNNGFLKAPNRSRMKFALMWANQDIGNSPGAIGRAGFDVMTDHIVRDYFSKSTYWKVDGRCYFSIYQLNSFIKGMGGVKQARAALDSFRKKAADAGYGGIYLNIVDWGIPSESPQDVKLVGADSVTSYVWIHKVKLNTFPKTDYQLTANRYFKYWDAHKKEYGVPYFPNITMGWDPSPRVPANKPYNGKTGYPDTPVLWNNTPRNFQLALEAAKARALTLPPGQRIVTIYAWNEWTEGGHLEPDTVNKMAYLRAIRDVYTSRP